MFKDLLKIALWLIGLSTLAYSGWLIYSRAKSHEAARSHLINYTRQGLKNVAAAIKVYSEIDRKSLTKAIDGMVILSGRDLYSILFTSENALDVLRPNDGSVQQKTLLDEWGREIHSKLEIHGGQQHIVLWSDGPNKRDDNCKGDDIVIELDVSVPHCFLPNSKNSK